MQLSLTQIARILGSRWRGGDLEVCRYSIDSRSLAPGDLFFAIRGPRHDGHDFVGQALEKGALAAVVDNSYRAAKPERALSLLTVSDTTLALQQLAHAVRRLWGHSVTALNGGASQTPAREKIPRTRERPPEHWVIGVTGSMGKTTTKEMIASLLEPRFSVLKSPGNLNNQYGVPLTLLALEPCHQVAVIEMGMSGPGEIGLLASLAEPQIGVVTNVAPVHLQFFDSLDAIARAKGELIEHLQSPATAVLNHDDERVRRFAEGFEGRVVTFGFTKEADYSASNVRTAGCDGKPDPVTEFEVLGSRVTGRFSLALPGLHNVENALAAIATSELFDIPLEDLQRALESFSTPKQRGGILKLPGGITVVNDAYNSNPRAMQRMLQTLGSWKGAKRRLLIAGEMLELGASSPDWHRQIGHECVQAGVDWLLAVQGNAQFFLEGAVEAGLPKGQAVFFLDAGEAGRFCRQIARAGDVILVKGSRGVHLERAIETLETAS